MYRLAKYQVLRQRPEEMRREAAVQHPTRVAREEREIGPYVVRDLSWELARYLDTEDFSAASASETPNSVSGHHGRTPGEERVSG
jgi:hypothetical protein